MKNMFLSGVYQCAACFMSAFSLIGHFLSIVINAVICAVLLLAGIGLMLYTAPFSLIEILGDLLRFFNLS